MNVYGVPFEIRSFLPLWAVGSILGATQKVDMRYTRKMGVVRILVDVTDVNHISESAEIVVGEGLYEIFSKLIRFSKMGGGLIMILREIKMGMIRLKVRTKIIPRSMILI